jgi:hypothetical protein
MFQKILSDESYKSGFRILCRLKGLLPSWLVHFPQGTGCSPPRFAVKHIRDIEILSPSSEQPLKQLLKAMVGAIAIKDWIDGKVFHPDSAIAISGL